MAAHIGSLQNNRLRNLVVPREHGAWGMLLVPLTTGVVVAAATGINISAMTLFTLAAMSLFWLRTPVESWLGTSAIKAQTATERKFVLLVSLGIGAMAATSIAALLWGNEARDLLMIGAVAALAFAAQAAVKRLGRKGRMPAQIIGAVGLTSTGAGAYYVATGRLDRLAVGLWLANWLFAGDQIHFVQMRIRSSRATTFNEKLKHGVPFLVAQAALIGVVLAACRFGLFPGAIMLAFLPVLGRGILWFVRGPQPLDVHRLGLTELAHAVLFGALLCVSFVV